MNGNEKTYKLLMIAPTSFYWQVSLYRVVAAHPRINLKVYFCCDEALHVNNVLREYKVDQHWGVGTEMLEGYDNQFLKNYSPWPSYTNWPVGLINPGIWRAIHKEKPDAVVVSAWTNVTWWMAIVASVKLGIPFFYHTDANGVSEHSKSKWKLWIKKFLLGKMVFPLADGFLTPGAANERLFSFYGVPDNKLVSFAYSWGYETLIESSKELVPMKSQLRKNLDISEDAQVILFCGRLIPEKNLFDLLNAFNALENERKVLILVGDGLLRTDLTKYVEDNNIEDVHFVGFQNRIEIPKYYALSDVLVLPSASETWGIVVNEALCFGLPVVVSDQVGAGYDLIEEGKNGFMYPVGDVPALTHALKNITDLSVFERESFKIESIRIIKEWLGRDVTGNLVAYLDKLYSD